MNHILTQHTFHNLTLLQKDRSSNLNWSSIFILPPWMETWWQQFGNDSELYLCDIKENNNVIGIAPLKVKDGIASFIGKADVCDYLDFIILPGKESAFFSAVLDKLINDGIRELHLESLRPDSATFMNLYALTKDRGLNVSSAVENVSLDLNLPSNWDSYLETLNAHQRREIGRKLRRLYEAGDVEYVTIADADNIQNIMNIFFKLLRDSRKDKAVFMTLRMESFFRSIASKMTEEGLLRIGILKINESPVATVMCFDYNEKVYLYNSGYNPQLSHLSVGLLSKVLSIKDSIERGMKTYDFLKGAEEYKYHLGGREFPISNMRIILK